MLHSETVSGELLALTSRLMEDKVFEDFRLVGGTALSLQIGHRISIDIDLFTDQSFDQDMLHAHIQEKYSPKQIQSDKGIVMARIDGIKVDCIAHKYSWLDAAIKERGFRMASLLDIAAMKLNAINDSGDRLKDFVDMYYLLERHSLNEIAEAYAKKYPDTIGSYAKHAIREFGNLTLDMVEVNLMDKAITWKIVEDRLRKAVIQPAKIFYSK